MKQIYQTLISNGFEGSCERIMIFITFINLSPGSQILSESDQLMFLSFLEESLLRLLTAEINGHAINFELKFSNHTHQMSIFICMSL